MKKEASSDGICLEIRVGGLLGGHSGTEINKERTNAIQLLGITLGQILGKVPFHLVQIYGGEKDNAIPREACAIVRLTAEAKECFVKEVKRIEKEEQNEKKSKEKDLFLRVKEIDMIPERIFDTASTQRILSFLMFLPNGVIAMSADIEGLVETSLNVGILKTTDTEIVASTAIRSAIETAKHKVFLQVDMLTKLLGGYTETHGVYPGWQFDPDSKLRADMMRIYQKMFGKEPKVEALHAGLECGIMISKIPGLDCVSYGPNIYDIHTTKERLSISSASRMWEYLLEILKQK